MLEVSPCIQYAEFQRAAISVYNVSQVYIIVINEWYPSMDLMVFCIICCVCAVLGSTIHILSSYYMEKLST